MQIHRTLDFHFRDSQQLSLREGFHASQVRTDTGDFHELRPYTPGESIAHLDFKRSRFDTDELVVRGYTQEKDYELKIVLILEPALRFGTQDFGKGDIVFGILGSLIESLWEHQFSGNIAIIDADSPIYMPIPGHAGELQKMFQEIEARRKLATRTVSPSDITAFCLQNFGERFDGGICIIADEPAEPICETLFDRYRTQTLRVHVGHEQEEVVLGKSGLLSRDLLSHDLFAPEKPGIPSGMPGKILALGDPPGSNAEATRYGAKISLTHPSCILANLQRSFQIW